MIPTCRTVAKWAIAPYGDPNEAVLSCDTHLVQFLEARASQKEGAGTDEFHVYPIFLENRNALCRHPVAEIASQI
jgi:hypothetical protein